MSSFLVPALLTGSALALVSAGHCALMCGPIALVSRMRGGRSASAAYFAGRLVAYAVAGGLAGSVGRALLLSEWARWVEAALSWTLALSLLGAAVALLRSESGSPLIALRKRPRVQLASRVLARLVDEPLLLGAATALLPCAVLFTALSAAASLGSAGAGALALSAFAVLTGAAVVGVAQVGALQTRRALFRRALGGVLLLGAGLMAYRPVPMLRAGTGVPACHGGVPSSNTQAEAL